MEGQEGQKTSTPVSNRMWVKHTGVEDKDVAWWFGTSTHRKWKYIVWKKIEMHDRFENNNEAWSKQKNMEQGYLYLSAMEL
jgi:hypothetical protein